MSLFLILINYISALVAVQLLRGDFKKDDTTNFGELFNAFLAIWQVFSSEDWTSVLYGAASAELHLGQALVVIVFMASWMLFSNCKLFFAPIPLTNLLITLRVVIVLQMFIAVINENFQVAEEAKKSEQASKFWATRNAREGKPTWMRVLNPYRWFKANPVTVRVDELPSGLVLPMQKNLVVGYGNNANVSGAASASTVNVAGLSGTERLLDGEGSEKTARPKVNVIILRQHNSDPEQRKITSRKFKPGHFSTKSLSALEKLFAGETMHTNDIPLATLRHARQPQAEPQIGTHVQEEVERYL